MGFAHTAGAATARRKANGGDSTTPDKRRRAGGRAACERRIQNEEDRESVPETVFTSLYRSSLRRSAYCASPLSCSAARLDPTMASLCGVEPRTGESSSSSSSIQAGLLPGNGVETKSLVGLKSLSTTFFVAASSMAEKDPGARDTTGLDASLAGVMAWLDSPMTVGWTSSSSSAREGEGMAPRRERSARSGATSTRAAERDERRRARSEPPLEEEEGAPPESEPVARGLSEGRTGGGGLGLVEDDDGDGASVAGPDAAGLAPPERDDDDDPALAGDGRRTACALDAELRVGSFASLPGETPVATGGMLAGWPLAKRVTAGVIRWSLLALRRALGRRATEGRGGVGADEVGWFRLELSE
ncbi:hypothetical protein DMC30DRAFT_387158 [Rhodotorula diobovata]|uniref:Uncharacterized protein n=1 Tax=Rhodotorula diobovata TaxID=5288 RepID=A0A5C5G5L2_9BASI|nr:hypothetical protein DMC30DRAFT_387158 [Rhodotorula diobovata]